MRLALEPPADVGAAYLCVLQRDVSKTRYRWGDQWPTVEKILAKFPDVRVVFAVCWPSEREPFVHYGGPWITAATVC